MKFCSKCGAENILEAKFCKECGNQFEEVGNNNAYTKDNNTSSNEGLGTASLVIGIIALILSFTCIIFLPIFLVVPLSLVGLILGIVNKAKHGKKIAGIILNVIAFILSIIMVVLFFLVIGYNIVTDSNPNGFFNRLFTELDYSSNKNYIAGTWNCKPYNGNEEDEEYTIKMILNKNKTFVFGDYDDLSNNHAGGTYTFEKEIDKNKQVQNIYKYFIVNLNGNENDYYIDGKAQNKEFKGKFEFGITSVKTKKQGILMNYNSYNMYYCYEN